MDNNCNRIRLREFRLNNIGTLPSAMQLDKPWVKMYIVCLQASSTCDVRVAGIDIPLPQNGQFTIENTAGIPYTGDVSVRLSAGATGTVTIYVQVHELDACS